jgi:octaprenyl-diphosphate synthase
MSELANPIEILYKHYKNQLSEVNSLILSSLSIEDSTIKNVSEHLILSGGKKIRALITIITSSIFGFQGTEHINLASAIELIHAATLLHDDVIDNSSYRRAKLTANLIWGNKSAILVGDYLFSKAFKLIVDTKSIEALEIISETSSTIVAGEIKQLEMLNSSSFSEDEYYNIILSKTSELFGAAAKVGAVIASAKDSVKEVLYQFGLLVGTIYQIKDDLIDYQSNLSSSGKNAGDDLKEGKITLPIIVAYSSSNEQEKEFWQRVFVLKTQTSEDFDDAIYIMEKYDVFAKVNAIIQGHYIQAVDLLLHFERLTKINTDHLRIALDAIVNRRK